MRIGLGVATAILIALAGTPNAAAASFTVTRFDDPPPNGCAPADCSLREALLATNSMSGLDSISLPAGHYQLSIPGPGEDAGATGDLDLTDNVSIRGPGARWTVIDAGGGDRVFDVAADVQAELDGVAVTGGQVSGNGGGIRNLGQLGLDGAAILDNHASGSGGGIEDAGRLLLSRSLLAGNHAIDGGGLHAGGADDLENTTVTGNVAGGPGTTGHGGGIDGSGGLRVVLESSTLTGNQSFNSALAGAGLNSISDVDVENTIISDNVAHSVDQTTSALANCAAPVSSHGHNISDGMDCGLLNGGDQQGSPVLLGPLADNGGGTDTEAVLQGSLALDSGGGCSGTDQRGVIRPRGAACDVGAYENAPPFAATLAASTIAFSTATLNGAIDPTWRGATWYFEYGRTEQYGSRTPDQVMLGNGLTPVSAPVTGLRQGATYHFRLVASGAEGTTSGDDHTFTTSDRTKPVLTLLRVVPGLFHRKNGATFSFTLTENATVTLRFDHVLRGVRKGKRCVKITRRNRKRRPCTRYLPVSGSVAQAAAEGPNSIHFDAKVGEKLLTFGAYRLRATPRDAAGNVGKTALAAFRVLR
jgi:hypothetical protein